MNAKSLFPDGRMPAVCVPIIARTRQDLLEDIRLALDQNPDLIEWRVDYFDEIADVDAVIETGLALHAIASNVPLVFTLRSEAEGGNATGLSGEQAGCLRLVAAQKLPFEYHDIEMSLPEALIESLLSTLRALSRKSILSCHDFQKTPPRDELESIFERAYRLGGDVAKLAVTPQSPEDVLEMLAATRHMSQALPIPVIGMSMGPLGVMSRIFAGVYGSALTFATATGVSAPGQIPLANLREIFDRLGMRPR